MNASISIKDTLAQVRARGASLALSRQPTRMDEAMPSAKGNERNVKPTVLMSTMERRREFGVMNAVGLRKSRLAAVLFVETVLLVSVGVLLGLLLSTPIIMWFNANPIPITGELVEVFEQFNIPPYMPFAMDPGIFAAQGLVVLLMALVVASFPIVSIRRLHIMRAITGR